MNVLFAVFGALVVGIIVVAWLMGRGRSLNLWDEGLWVVDPLDLQPLGTNVARIYMSVPRVDGVREVIELIVNAENRPKYLRHGPIAFLRGLRRMGLVGEARCLVGRDRDLARLVSLEELQQKLFDDMDPAKAVRLIHDMTEVDLSSVEDEEVVAEHLLRAGFEPLTAPKKEPPVHLRDLNSQRYRVWGEEEV